MVEGDYNNIVIANITIEGMKVEPSHVQKSFYRIGKENSKV